MKPSDAVLSTIHNLVKLTQCGESSARQELIKLVRPYLVAYVWQCVNGDRDLSEDMVQDGLITILRSLPGFQPRSPASTWAWLKLLTRNQASRHLGRAQHRANLLRQRAELGGALYLPCNAELIHAEWMAELRQALDCLTPKELKTLTLKAQGQSHDEIVGAGISSNAVQSRVTLNRARRKLRQQVPAAVQPRLEKFIEL